MTEDEAETKWCPFAHASEGFLQDGRLTELKCIASACMAWRFNRIANPAYNPVNQFNSVIDRNPYEPDNRYVVSTTEGYCGLAGGQP